MSTEELAMALEWLSEQTLENRSLTPHTLRAAAARLRELEGVIRKAFRISIRHDHETTRLADLHDLLAAQLTETSDD